VSFRLSHLAILLALSILVAAIGGVVSTWRVADEAFRDVLDEDLENQSELLAELLAADGAEFDEDALEDLLDEAFEPEGNETLWVTVYDRRSGRSVSNFPHDFPLDDPERETVRRTYDGHDWRGYQSDEGRFVVQMLRREDLYREVQADVLEDIITPITIASLASLLLLALFIGFSLWPLTRFARQIEARNAHSLEPIAARAPAHEMRVLRDALNRLIEGVSGTLARERRFASDVAHELRTPLTTLKLELAGPEPDLEAAKAEVDRLSRLVGQLLTLARLDGGQWRQQFMAVQLDELGARIVDHYRERFREAGIGLDARFDPARVEGDPTLLEVLLRNLLENVLRHCPAGTRADVVLGAAGGSARLTVADTGPGIAEEQRRRMAQGFTRLDSRGAGLGLGLAISRRIAEVHNASLAFEARNDGTPGLVVTVTFAIAPAPL
jgi:signal transduction histidine kinase